MSENTCSVSEAAPDDLLCSGCHGCLWHKVERWHLTHEETHDCTHDPKPADLFEVQDYNVECPYKEHNVEVTGDE